MTEPVQPHRVMSLTGVWLDSAGQQWLLECEARMVLRMEQDERAQFFDGVRKKRKEAGLTALRLRCHALEPYYVLSLPTREERRAYAARVGRQFGERHRLALEDKVRAIAAERVAGSGQDGA